METNAVKKQDRDALFKAMNQFCECKTGSARGELFGRRGIFSCAYSAKNNVPFAESVVSCSSEFSTPPFAKIIGIP